MIQKKNFMLKSYGLKQYDLKLYKLIEVVAMVHTVKLVVFRVFIEVVALV